VRSLVAGELRRVLARRLVMVVVLLAGAAIVVGASITFARTHSISDAAYRAQVEAARSQVLDRTGLSACPPGAEPTPLSKSGPQGFQPSCLPAFAFGTVRDPRFYLRKVPSILQGVTAPLVIAALLIAASAIGADWQSRTVTTILTWEARRVRVLAAKVLACIIVSAALSLAVLTALSVAFLPSALFHGTTAGTGGDWWRSLVGVVLRALAMSGIAATIGFSIAMVGRNTAAALGAGFAYIVVIENVVGQFLRGWRRWLVLGNSIVFVSGRTGHNSGVPGRSVAVAGLYLTAVGLVLLTAAAVAFVRRDVA
jgi:ABC-2 type transport system permease protein